MKRSGSYEEKAESTPSRELAIHLGCRIGKLQAAFRPAVLFHLSCKVQMMADFSDPELNTDSAGLPLNHPVLMKHTNYPN